MYDKSEVSNSELKLCSQPPTTHPPQTAHLDDAPAPPRRLWWPKWGRTTAQPQMVQSVLQPTLPRPCSAVQLRKLHRPAQLRRRRWSCISFGHSHSHYLVCMLN